MLDVELVNNSICSECGNEIKIDRYIYCEKCYDNLIEENNELKKEIKELKAEQKNGE